MQWYNRLQARQRWDWHLVLYFLNVFLVVYGYGLRGESFQAAKMARTLLVVLSLGGIFFFQGPIRYIFSKQKNRVLYGFILLYLITLPFSVEFYRSLERIVSWIPFLIYTNYFILYLFSHYSKDEAKIKLLLVFSLAYFYPVAGLFLNGIAFQSENVYGQYVGLYKANVLGWACTVFVVMSFDIYANRPLSTWLRLIYFAVISLILWAVVLTGSRSSYAALGVTTLLLVVRSQRISVYLKIAATLCIIGFAYYIITSPDSVVNLRAQYAGIRQQTGEIRFQLAQKALDIFSNHPAVFFTGFGFDNFQAGLKHYAGIQTDLASHNSYLEVLFSGGIVTFLFFMVCFVGNAVFKYLRFDSRQYVFLPSLMIIPYFESNLNAGQFLFFPWMTFLFYYIHVSSPQLSLFAAAMAKNKEHIRAEQ